jgi:hypothetical protein
MANKLLDLTPDEQADHARSIKDYPDLDLAEDEYVAIDVKRGRIGLVYIWLVVFGTAALFIGLSQTLIWQSSNVEWDLLLIIFGYLATFIAIGFGMVASVVYRKNYLIISNRRVFARIQNTIFAYREQVVELDHVEDVSVFQGGVLPLVFRYGTIRLSTVGDEHTYAFSFVNEPHEQIRIIRKLVDAADKNSNQIL